MFRLSLLITLLTHLANSQCLLAPEFANANSNPGGCYRSMCHYDPSDGSEDYCWFARNGRRLVIENSGISQSIACPAGTRLYVTIDDALTGDEICMNNEVWVDGDYYGTV